MAMVAFDQHAIGDEEAGRSPERRRCDGECVEAVLDGVGGSGGWGGGGVEAVLDGVGGSCGGCDGDVEAVLGGIDGSDVDVGSALEYRRRVGRRAVVEVDGDCGESSCAKNGEGGEAPPPVV
jgi:hypothetical protein